MHFFSVLGGVLVFCAAPVLAQSVEDAPLSAIDWLSESVEQPPVAVPVLGTQATRAPDANEDPVANSAPGVSVQTLGGPAQRALGLLSPEVTGFPVDLWENSDAETLAALFLAEKIDTLPALQELLTTPCADPSQPATQWHHPRCVLSGAGR